MALPGPLGAVLPFEVVEEHFVVFNMKDSEFMAEVSEVER